MIKQIFPLALISSLRFFGLFIVLPIIGLYTDEFHTSAFLAGLAAGGYALTQIIFQTPFGIWSDKYNRKHIVGIGLIIFLLGSLVCAFSTDITMLIIGRFLQGVGAIGGVVSAQIADLVKEEERNKAMAVMGAGIFISFILAMLLSPIVASHYGLNTLFFITSALCVISLIILYWKVPNTPSVKYHFQDNTFNALLKDKNLLIMNLSAFLQKFLMIFAFVCISLALTHQFDMPEEKLWYIYAPAALIGVFAMGPSSVFAQKKGQFKAVMLFGICAFMFSYFLMAFSIPQNSLILFASGVLIFFIGFAIHEPIMQSLASRYPKAHQKGAALGIFTTLGYVGSALGGMCGGWLYEEIGLFKLSLIIAAVCIIWVVLLIVFLSNPRNHKNIYLPLDEKGDALNQLTNLDTLEGVIEWYINQNEHIAIIKYDDTLIQKEQILSLLHKG
ncbi:MFS transporter [Helicobacter sp. MIT 21-1697]|uniref:MFS transporter n=1 Tax=Helicobacter sp. MIT 21-1697 TaxID=2993733 RepID=UPI00224A7C6A|nr:MFS transporter [Helicobacter sp. MIT 21-1697]MCX2717272.1 MFS transporter [Helicobacter sp. MIT 21-1697]